LFQSRKREKNSFFRKRAKKAEKFLLKWEKFFKKVLKLLKKFGKL